MPDLLLEFFGEEIPARMQQRAAEDLKRLLTDALVEAGLVYESARAFATPRRLALAVGGIPVQAPDTSKERKGPRVDAPDKAVAGFLRAAGLTSLDQAERRSDAKKGDYYVAVTQSAGRPAVQILAELIPDIVRRFPWPKSMRWGARSGTAGALKWVRPLHAIVATFGPETEDPEIVRFEIDGIAAGDTTYGHRFHAPAPIRVRRFNDYVAHLETAHVILDAERRADIIVHDARDRALALGLELVEDPGLLAEVAGLVEWPVVLVGTFDEAFARMPDEVIRTSIRNHQKCFVLRDPKTGGLANKFLPVANLDATDGGAAIINGNERVIRARLADAEFFWQADLKCPLPDQARKLQVVVFHERLGTQAERVDRMRALAVDIAPQLGADPAIVDRAALLAKADLMSQMVGEFPELQGLMGRIYALRQDEDPAVAGAIEDHYLPQGPSDRVPTDPVAIAVALADKLDMLAGFWAIGETPTGSKDPYGLRRAALGVIRILLENNLDIAPRALMDAQIARMPVKPEVADPAGKVDQLCLFLEDRLKVQLRRDGARHDLVDAVLGQASIVTGHPLTTIVRRVEALGDFLDTEDGANLLAGYRRAANILRLEEKKDGRRFDGAPRAEQLIEPAEIDLAAAIDAAASAVRNAVEGEDFNSAMAALAGLRGPVDAFFDDILVNADDPQLRENRLMVLNKIRQTTRQVAEFSKIS